MLYGLDVRQPIGGDFGFSGELANAYLAHDVWETDVARFGIDIWMTTTAIAEGFRVCQARLGAKIHDAKDPAESLGPMFVQVVGTLFRLMGQYADRWQVVEGSQPTPIIGPAVEGEPEPVPVTVMAMIDKFRVGLTEHSALWERILTPDHLVAVRMAASLGNDDFQFPAETWVRTVFDFALAYNQGGLPAAQIIRAMTPLYYARTASVVREGWEMSTAEFEQQVVQAQAKTFEALKPELIERWGGI